jgi:hypothetical protein
MCSPVTSRLTKDQYDVLNAIVLKKMATFDAVERATDRGEPAIADAISDLVAAGLVVDIGGSLLPTDPAADALVADAEFAYASLREDPAVLQSADKFDSINSAFLKVMSDWQLVPLGDRTVANDHSDAEYDGKVIDRIDKLVSRLSPVLAAFAEHDGRFTCYRRRFDEALTKVDQGQTDFVSAPTVDSVHNVWFEFHEDLLRSLGRERVE